MQAGGSGDGPNHAIPKGTEAAKPQGEHLCSNTCNVDFDVLISPAPSKALTTDP